MERVSSKERKRTIPIHMQGSNFLELMWCAKQSCCYEASRTLIE